MSNSPLRRVLIAAASVSFLAAPLVAVTTPADAAARCSIDNFSPRTVVIGLSPVKATIRPSISGCTVGGWDLDADSFYTYDANPEEVFYPPFDNKEVAPQDVVASVYNEDYDVTNRIFNDGFRIKRATTWDKVNASPEPARKGARITVQARLRIADWTNDRYVGLVKKDVVLEQRTPNGSYTTVKTVKTASGGYVKTYVTAGSDKCFRFRYAGASYAGSKNSAGDCVDVK